MSFIIRNTSGGSVTVDDLGINLPAPLDEHNLSQEPPNDVAISSDLPANITAGNIAVLDPLDGITPLSIVDALELIAATNDPHYRIRGGHAVDVLFDNSGTDNAGTNLQSAVVDNSGKVEWKNIWADQAYDKNDMVVDGDWTMVANTQTTDRAAPQNIGGPETTPPSTSVFTSVSDVSVIKMVHHYVATKNGFVETLKVRVPFWDLDSVSRITIFNITDNTAIIINNPILTSDEWVTIRATNGLFTAGTVFEVWFEFYNSSAANNVSGGWNSATSAGTPISQEFTIDNASTPTVIQISHTDLDSTNRATELDGVSVNSIITISETSAPDRSVEVIVTAIDTAPVNDTKYTVTLLQNGSKNIRDNKTCTISIDVPITQPSQYSFIPDFYLGTTNQPSFATVTTELYYDGVQQADVNDAYGIEVIFQELSVSPDWDVAVSPGSAGGGSDGTGGEANTASNLGAGSGVFAQKNLTDLEFKSLTAGTSILLTPSGSEIQITNLDPNIVQNLWSVILGDTGSTAANIPTDTLTLAGGIDISTSIIGDVVTIDYTPADIDLASVTLGMTTNVPIQLVMTDITWDIVHLQNNTLILERDVVNQERILIKETGLYLIGMSVSFDADALEEQISMQILQNGTTIVPGSFRLASEDDEINDLSNTFTALLTAGDYITLQIMANGTGNVLHNSSNMSITRARGTKGAKGDTGVPGSGSTVVVQDEGTSIPNSPHTALNFIGGLVVATDGGSGVANITIDSTATDLASVTLGFVTTFPLALVMTDVVWDITHLENNIAVIEHDNTLTQRVLIKETGLYFINFAISFDADIGEEQISAQVFKNGTTIVPGSFRLASEDDEINDLSNAFTALLVAGDYITLQVMANGTGNTLHNSTNFCVTRAQGIKGSAGAPGAGSTIIIQEEGVSIPNTPHSTLNFTGSVITATDVGAGVTNIDVIIPTKNQLSRHNGAVTQTFSTTPITVNFGTDLRTDTNYTHNLVVGGSEITINTTGWYTISFDVSADNTGNSRRDSHAELEVNNIVILGTRAHGYHRNIASGETTFSTTVKLLITAGDVIRVRMVGSGALVTIINSNRLNIELIDSP